MTKHTPGPWMPHHDKGRLYVETHRDDVICMVARGLGTPEDQANASLIAAAPELLSQLEFAVALLKPMLGHTAQVERMEDAIAKATGGTTCR